MNQPKTLSGQVYTALDGGLTQRAVIAIQNELSLLCQHQPDHSLTGMLSCFSQLIAIGLSDLATAQNVKQHRVFVAVLRKRIAGLSIFLEDNRDYVVEAHKATRQVAA